MSDENRTWTKVGVFTIDDQEFHGELQYHATDGIELIVQGPGGFADKPRDYSIIHGMLEGSTPVTLVDCFDTNINFNFAGFVRRRLTANYVLQGMHLDSIHTPQFRFMDFSSSACSQWYAQTGLEVDNLRKSTRVEFDVHYQQPTRIRHKLDELRSIEIWSGPLYSSGPDNDGKLVLKDIVGALLRYKKKRSLSEILADARALDIFFCLAAGEFSGPPMINLRTKTFGKKNVDRDIRKKLFISQYWFKEKEAKHPSHRTLILSDMRGNLPVILANWFEKWKSVSRVFGLYMVYRERTSDLLLQFLMLSQSLEGLHRAFYDSNPISGKEFQSVLTILKRAIPANASKEARQFFRDRLPRWNEPSMRGRLKHLFRELNIGDGQFFINANKDVELIVKYRNEFTHVLGSDISEMDINKISYLVAAMDALFIFSIFRLAGVDHSVLEDAFRRNWRYGRIEKFRQEMLG